MELSRIAMDATQFLALYGRAKKFAGQNPFLFALTLSHFEIMVSTRAVARQHFFIHFLCQHV